MTRRSKEEINEAKAVNDFVEGRKQVNAGNGLQRTAKKYFDGSKKIQWMSEKWIITLETESRMKFDSDAFIAKFGIDEYNKFYKPMPTQSYKVTLKV